MSSFPDIPDGRVYSDDAAEKLDETLAEAIELAEELGNDDVAAGLRLLLSEHYRREGG